jgi:E3 ubiquitin-protein ligase DOA10
MSTTEQVNASSSLSSSGDDGVAVCYLCLGGGVDDNSDQPLRRDCACRGTDAGFVHLACLTDYAETRSEQALDMNEFVTDEFAKFRGFRAPVVTKNIRMSLLSILRTSLYRSFEGSIQTILEDRGGVS